MNTLNLIYYSPTGTTKKIVKEIGRKVGLKLTSEHNITKSKTEAKTEICSNSLTIIGLPVYGGRLPTAAIKALKMVQSNQSLAVIVVVYGNRDYDDSLLELKKIVKNCGFKVIAGASFIGEHSFSSKDKPIASGRPDKQDLIKCSDFAWMIHDKLNNTKGINKILEPDIPGQYPYKELKQLPSTVYPETDNDNCNKCGSCVDICPSGAITIDQIVKTNGELCTWCCSCVKNCPTEARIFDHPTINSIKEKLFLNCSIRKEPEYFL